MLARLLRSPVNWFMGYSSEPSDEHDDNDNMDIDTTPNDTYVPPISYEPTILDVLVVKAMLHRALRLPPEILDAIADWAEYWPHTSTEIDYTNRPAHARKDASLAVENQFLLRTPPLGFVRPPFTSPEYIETPPPPKPLQQEFDSQDFQDLIASRVRTIVRPCRRIIFTTTSRDQGWGGFGNRGAYFNSWTWFEAGLERCNKRTGQGGGDSPSTESTESTEGSPESEQFEIDSTGQTDSTTPTPPRPSFDLPSLATLKPAVGQDPLSAKPIFLHQLLPPDDCTIQRNDMIDRTNKEHRVVWSYTDDIPHSTLTQLGLSLEERGRGKATGNGEFVRNLKLGDIVTVWAKARFPGWVNYVENVKVDVYWAV